MVTSCVAPEMSPVWIRVSSVLSLFFIKCRKKLGEEDTLDDSGRTCSEGTISAEVRVGNCILEVHDMWTYSGMTQQLDYLDAEMRDNRLAQSVCHVDLHADRVVQLPLTQR